MLLPRRLESFFSRSFTQFPDKPCVIESLKTYSYREIETESNALAHWLIQERVSPGDRIGILLGPGRLLYIVQIAILKAGAAYVPIDMGYPADRIRFILEDAGISMLFASSLSLIQPEPNIRIVDYESLNLASLPITPVHVDHEQDAICYVCYTSGTSGKPKGVVITHANICHFITVATPCYGFTSEDRVYQGLSPAFDFSIEEIWTTWAVGGALVPRPPHVDTLGSGLRAFLEEQRVTVLACIPTLLATLDGDLPSLRILMVSGEACPQALANRWARPGLVILNTYGPTEGTVTATWKRLEGTSQRT